MIITKELPNKNVQWFSVCHRYHYREYCCHTLKTERHQLHQTGDTVGCYNENLRCHQWRQYKLTDTDWQKSPDSKIHGANMGPTWVLSAPDGPHVGAINLAIRVNMKVAYVHWCPVAPRSQPVAVHDSSYTIYYACYAAYIYIYTYIYIVAAIWHQRWQAMSSEVGASF